MKADKSADDEYSSKFKSTEWINLALGLSSILLVEEKYLEDCIVRRKVITALLLVIDLTFELRRNDFTLENLVKLRKMLLPNALSALLDMYLFRQKQKQTKHIFSGIKMHILLHMDYFIRRFGTPQIWDTDTFESAHKDMVKNLYRRSSKRIDNIEMEILTQV